MRLAARLPKGYESLRGQSPGSRPRHAGKSGRPRWPEPLFHHVGNIVDAHDIAPLLAEFSDKHVIRRKHAERNLWTIVSERIERRQIGIGHGQRKANDQYAN